MKNFLFIIFCISLYCNSFGQSSVFDIARKGTLTELKELHKKFPDTINTTNDAGYSPLILACYNGNNEVASFIATHCKNVNNNSGYGTALMAAVVKGNKEMVEELLELNADPNITDGNGTTALHYAVLFQLEPIISALLHGKADPTMKDDKGFSPVDYAMKTNNETIMKLLK